MQYLIFIDWTALVVPQHSILEMILRGTVMYLAIFVLLRVLARRQAGSLGTADLLVVVLLADAAQNWMAHDYRSVTKGIALVVTILMWDFVIDWMSFRIPALQTLLHPQPLPLIKKGVLQRKNMRQEMISTDELMSHLREEGLESPKQVKLAQLEGDGHLSVIKLRA